jgi:large subunit ribosomal protein L17
MRHLKKKKIGNGRDHKRKLMRSLAANLVLYERIETTLIRAKLVKSAVERLITKAKKGDLHSKRQLFSALPANAARKTFEVYAPKYADRRGGYTRIIRVGNYKDGMPKAVVEFV